MTGFHYVLIARGLGAYYPENHARPQKHLHYKGEEKLVTDDKHINITDLSTWEKQIIS